VTTREAAESVSVPAMVGTAAERARFTGGATRVRVTVVVPVESVNVAIGAVMLIGLAEIVGVAASG
jgi:hypothetical protein